jgi:fatty acid synthase subunit alpha
LIQLHGDAKSAAAKAGVKSVNVSISHDEDQAVAVAVSSF